MEIILGENHTINPKFVKSFGVDGESTTTKTSSHKSKQPVSSNSHWSQHTHEQTGDSFVNFSPTVSPTQQESLPQFVASSPFALSLRSPSPFNLPPLSPIASEHDTEDSPIPISRKKKTTTTRRKTLTPEGFEKVKKPAKSTKKRTREEIANDDDDEDNDSTPAGGARKRKNAKLKETKLQESLRFGVEQKLDLQKERDNLRHKEVSRTRGGRGLEAGWGQLTTRVTFVAR